MKKPVKKTAKKMRKADFEVRFATMVGEYNSAKEVLDALPEGSPDYAKQKKKCDSLFAAAERFINTNQ
ncbi:hypothetical protein BOO29_11160 [Vibrio navarrensis]|jgi:hypothetical protein|uniref:Uncharacterized protein n=2 Tax=Vibrio TaxID=662 RepID=A0A099M2U8_9VIBR|nr:MULTISPECIES: hypothetical protein [Vibrio]EGR2797496.1 hypothetical protein [Vibrio navarrensis]EJK2114091.1 hypothetical protein [Vibrio navarrensis]EJL6393670.1 hypothetical protein [Vibrio navarrensis]EJL6400652.1 hypothetical protein [Vibrio navarrensis]EJL6565917.1 hypothetical protein [Vibrio navarrensis]